MTWDDAVSFALSLPATEFETSYGQPAVIVTSNGRTFLFRGHEIETSFGLALDLETIERLKFTAPETFWQTPHYEGWSGVLVRYDSKDEEGVRRVIRRSLEWTAARPPARARLPRRKSRAKNFSVC